MTQPRVLLGVVVNAHGIKGEVKVKTFTESPDRLNAYGPLTTEDGHELEIAALRVTKGDEAVVRFAGVLDRNRAETFKGQRLYVPRAALPDPEAGAFYHSDLIGLRAEDASGAALGTIQAVHNFGAGDVLEIEFANGGTEFVPFTDPIVPVVDIAGGRVVVHLPRDQDG
ncbi:MAG TPA: ribosome maturation factor RimM [Micropepsaceae bacterium]|nr:ribosome maturation factor RimM [Micropepsaceae bacterium]